MSENPTIYIEKIQSQLNTMQLYLDKLHRLVNIAKLSVAVADDAELAEDISNNAVVFQNHELVVTNMENYHNPMHSHLLENLLGKTSYELHTAELNKLFPSGVDEPAEELKINMSVVVYEPDC